MTTPHTTTYHPLGASGLKVSNLWLGTMMFGDQTDAIQAASIVDASRDAGINAIDTANAYAAGESEHITGRLIATDRERWVLATKLANPMGPGPNERGLSRKHMISALDASLKRLNTDFVDVLYLHREDPSTPLEETLTAVAQLIERGKVFHFGLSNFRWASRSPSFASRRTTRCRARSRLSCCRVVRTTAWARWSTARSRAGC
jgi:aryl-alcohol dehydrogenase-like predicted oxidoreductase